MQSMIVARLLATRDLLLNRYSHHISILNLQFAHRLSPREKNDAMISLCCIISVVVFRARISRDTRHLGGVMAVMSPLFNALRASRPAHRVKNTLRSLDDKLMNLPAHANC